MVELPPEIEIVGRDEADSAAVPQADRGPDPGAPATVEWEGKTWPVVRQAHLSEDVHVAAEALATKIAISRGLKDHDGKRVERAKKYARWRYRGYLAGEIASL